MATHSISITAVANEDLSLYSSVKLVSNTEVDGLPVVEMTDTYTDVILGIAMSQADAGDRVTVRLPYSGILPAYAYTNIRSGDGLTIGLAYPGSFSNSADAQFSNRVAYVMQTSGSTADPTRCAIIMVRAYYQ